MTQLKRAKSARKLDTCPLCSGQLTPIHARELLCDDCGSIFQPDVVERYTRTASGPELVEAASVGDFAKAILHGDAEHRAWLMEAAECWDSGRTLPQPRSQQPKPRESISLPPELKGVDLLADPFGDGESAAFPIGALLKRCRQHIDATRSGSSVERGHSLELLADIDKYLKGEG